jgi:hypothetical protein
VTLLLPLTPVIPFSTLSLVHAQYLNLSSIGAASFVFSLVDGSY